MGTCRERFISFQTSPRSPSIDVLEPSHALLTAYALTVSIFETVFEAVARASPTGPQAVGDADHPLPFDLGM